LNLQQLLNDPKAGRIVLRLSQSVPPTIGIPLAKLIANWIALHSEIPLVQAIRTNQWVIQGNTCSREELDQRLKISLFHLTISYYLFFHYLNNPKDLQQRVDFGSKAEAFLQYPGRNKRGCIVAGLHMSYFDMVYLTAGWRGLKAVALSLPENAENTDAAEWQNHLRRQLGLQILPANFSNMRQIVQRLRSREVVLTGIDRAIPDSKIKLNFFNHPADLPVHHIQMALMADVPIIVITAILDNHSRFRVLTSDSIEMQRSKDHHADIITNAEKILEIAEGFIRQAPEQWTVTQAVWPQLISQIP